MSVTIRDAQPFDRALVTAGLQEMAEHAAEVDPWHHVRPSPGLGEVDSARLFREVRKMGGFILVAEVGGRPIGFAAGWALRPTRVHRLEFRPYRGGFISDLAVRTGWRRRGVGSALLSAAEARLRKAGCNVILLNVFYPNRAGRALYRRFRYTPRGMTLAKRVGPAVWTWRPALGKPRQSAVRPLPGRTSAIRRRPRRG